MIDENIFTASIMQANTFRAVFRTTSILLPFLNELLVDVVPDKLDHIDVPGHEQQVIAEGHYHIFHDIRARDSEGNAYVIEIERAREVHDVVRFQYTAARVFVKLIDTRYREMYKNATDAAKATKAIRKPIREEDVFKPKDVPTVIVIVIVEEGMAEKKFSSAFTADDQYTLFATCGDFGPETRKKFMYIDLKRFARTKKLENPETPLDHWCSFIWRTKDRRIEKKLLEKLEKFPGIREAVEVIRNLATQEMLEFEAMRNEEETLREEGREEGRKERGLDVARKILKKNMDDATIIDLTGISADQLKELKSSL